MPRDLTGPAALVTALLVEATSPEIDPPVIEATEAAVERLLLSEALGLVRDKNYPFAVARLAPLTESRFLPAEVTKAIPGLIEDLRRLDAVTRLAATNKQPGEKLPTVSFDLLPNTVKRPLLGAELVQAAEILLDTPLPNAGKPHWTVEQANKLLDSIAGEFGAEATGQLRVELSAKLFLAGQSTAANDLLEGETPNEHAREALADLRSIILGGGTLVNPQIARFLPAKGLKELPGVAPLVPIDQLEKWQPPKPPAETETTLVKLTKRARKDLAAESAVEANRLTGKVKATVDKIGTALAKSDAPIDR